MRIIGQEQIADLFGVAPKTIVEWQEQGLPIALRGRPGVASEYESAACVEWYMQRELNKVQAETPRDRLARLQADKIELELEAQRGTLVPADLIEPMWLSLVTAAKNHLRAEPDRLAHLMEHAETVDAKRDLLAETFEEFLRKLSKYDPGSDDDDDSNDDGSTRPIRAGSPAPTAAPCGPQAGAAAQDVGGPVG